jgi:hypothetical protein
MDDPTTPAACRDELADDRDEVADRRDVTADQRDEAAGRRDDDAADRDVEVRRVAHESVDRHRRLRNQILDHCGRQENTAPDLDEWSDLSPAALAAPHARGQATTPGYARPRCHQRCAGRARR